MSDALDRWIPYEGGATIGKPGSENGVMLEDEEYAAGARITLERNGDIAPCAITCGRYGLFVHTRFFSSEEEARREYFEMKIELGCLVDLSSDPVNSDQQMNGILMAAAGQFIDRFPT